MILKYVIKTLYRQLRHSLLMIGVAFILFLLFYRFIMNIKADETEIDRLYHTVEVTGSIKQRGASSINAQVPMELVNKIVNTGFIEHEVLDTMYYAFTFRRFNTTAVRFNNHTYIDVSNQPNLIGVSDLENSSLLPKGMDITFAKGYDAGMFSKDKPICIVSRRYMEDYQLSYGDSIGILGEFANEYTLYWDIPPEEIVKKLSKGYVYTICGSYECGTLSLGINTSYMLDEGDFIVPARTILDHFDKLYYYKETNIDLYLKGTYDFIRAPVVYRAAFAFRNTRELDIFRQFLIENDLTDTPTGESKFMFVLNDGQLINSIRPLQSSLSFKKSLLGLIYFLICIISFFLAFLSAHRRLGYIAILRSLGTSKLQTFLQILIEHMILGGIGVILAILIISLSNIKSITIPVLEIFLYYSIYLSGSIVALLYILKISTMKILTKVED
jgi:hypothetical protein